MQTRAPSHYNIVIASQQHAWQANASSLRQATLDSVSNDGVAISSRYCKTQAGNQGTSAVICVGPFAAFNQKQM